MGSRRKTKVAASAWLVALGWTLATVATCIGVVSDLFSTQVSLVLFTIGLSSSLIGQAMLERDRLRDAIDLRHRLTGRRHRLRRDRGRRLDVSESVAVAVAARSGASSLSGGAFPFGGANVSREGVTEALGDGLREAESRVRGEYRPEGVEREIPALMLLRLAESLEGAGGATWSWDVSTGVVQIADRWSRSLGYEPTQIEPRIEAWTSLLHPEDRTGLIMAVERHVRGVTEDLALELRAMSRSGSWQSFELRGRVIERGEAGEPLRMSGLLFAVAGISGGREACHDESVLQDASSSSGEGADGFGLGLELAKSCEEKRSDGEWMGADGEEGFISLEGVRVLVAEDGPEHQRILRWQLERLGCRVVMVDEGQAALARLVSAPHDFDLLLLDMQMPVMDGYTTARRLRDVGFELPIVALTSYLAEGERQRCREAGCDAWLEKPIHRERLRSSLTTLLRRASSRSGFPAMLEH